MRGRDMRWRGGRYNRGNNFNRGGFGGGFGRGARGRGRGFEWNQQQRSNRTYDCPGPRLSEDQIGATEYMSEHEGFNGIIKSRYSDFQVSEININGEVAQLTDITPPKPPVDDKQVEEDEELLTTKYNVEILPLDVWDNINQVASGTRQQPVEIDVTTSTKEERTRIHETVKKAFGHSIVGSTLSIDDKKFVKFEKFKKGVRIDTRVKWTWPAEFVHFMVHKENCDTMEAAAKIAERLRNHIKPSMMGYAGTKDRRAKTTQWFSLRKVDPKKIANACRDMREIKVGNYSFHDYHLKLGMLKGNKFRVALRNVTADDSLVEAACERLKERGFINYYGLQRFGTRVEVPTYEIGKKLLRGNFQEAINSILTEREGPLQEALRLYKEAGPVAAYNAIPRYASSHVEAKLIQALAELPNDLYYAMQKVPRNTRLLYLHSYQSLIWNRCVSERIRKYGLTPAVGDLVPLQPDQIQEVTDDEESDTEEGDNSKPDTDIKPETNEQADKNVKKEKLKEKVPVKVLTQEDVDSGNYSIYDVVMPLPGHFIEYPPNMKDYYEKLLSEDGLQLELKHKNRSYCMAGAYRHVSVLPTDVSWRLVRYSDPYADLILSDADLMDGRLLDGIVDDGDYKALLLTFTLPLACYATMLLRELLRVDTSARSQAAKNNYHKRRGDSHSGGDEKRSKEDIDISAYMDY